MLEIFSFPLLGSEVLLNVISQGPHPEEVIGINETNGLG